MFVDKLVRDILDVLLVGSVKYDNFNMVKFLSGDTDFNGVELKHDCNSISIEIPVYNDGYFDVNYTHNGFKHTMKLKSGRNILLIEKRLLVFYYISWYNLNASSYDKDFK